MHRSMLAIAIVALLAAVPVQAADQVAFSEVSLSSETGSGSPSGLVEGADGALYTVGAWGGAYGLGTIIRHVRGEDAAESIYSFSGGDGRTPWATLLPMQDGSLWGTTVAGGVFGHGTVFRFDPATRELQRMHSFNGVDGHRPHSKLLLATDGLLYGTTEGEGEYPSKFPGTLFRIDPKTGDLDVIRRFTSRGPDSDLGRFPSGLMQARDGYIYGTCLAKGPRLGSGSLYRLDPRTGTTALMHTFNAEKDGCGPQGPLIQARDQRLYGIADACGRHDWGTLYRVGVGGHVKVVHHFAARSNGGDGHPTSVLEGPDGFLYGGASAPLQSGVWRVRLDGRRFQVIATMDPLAGWLGSYPGALTEINGQLWGKNVFPSVFGQGYGTLFTLAPLSAP
jgi:uncharacterized repeat protein (TIGR03803 family)